MKKYPFLCIKHGQMQRHNMTSFESRKLETVAMQHCFVRESDVQILKLDENHGTDDITDNIKCNVTDTLYMVIRTLIQ